jgi:hypothetical protein
VVVANGFYARRNHGFSQSVPGTDDLRLRNRRGFSAVFSSAKIAEADG